MRIGPGGAVVGTFMSPCEKECGNADFHDLDEARRIAHGYYNEVLLHLGANNTAYPADDNNEPQKSK